jgi:hypothetical protein
LAPVRSCHENERTLRGYAAVGGADRVRGGHDVACARTRSAAPACVVDELPLARDAQIPPLTMGILKKIAFVSAATVAAGMLAKAVSSKKAPEALSKAKPKVKAKVKAAASEVTAKAKSPRKRKPTVKRVSKPAAA